MTFLGNYFLKKCFLPLAICKVKSYVVDGGAYDKLALKCVLCILIPRLDWSVDVCFLQVCPRVTKVEYTRDPNILGD